MTVMNAKQRLKFSSLLAIRIEQEAFEKCWTHSPLRAAARRIAIHQVSLLSHAATVARRLRIDVHKGRRQQQRQRVTEGTAMAP